MKTPDLMAACKKLIALDKERDRLAKKYSAGTCNADDAWNDFHKRHEKARAEMRAAMKVLKD